MNGERPSLNVHRHYSDRVARRRRRWRFRFTLWTLLAITTGCCVIFKLMQAFPPDAVLATVVGALIGVGRAWRRGTQWSAVGGAAVAFCTLHWRFLIPGSQSIWFAEPAECFLGAAMGSLLGAEVSVGSASKMEATAESPIRDRVVDRGWWGPLLWLVAGAAFLACAILDPWPTQHNWGVLKGVTGNVLLLSSVTFYLACLIRDFLIYKVVVSRLRRNQILSAVVAVGLGVLYLVAFFEASSSVAWQNTSAHGQNHWGSILVVLSVTFVFVGVLLAIKLAERLFRRDS